MCWGWTIIRTSYDDDEKFNRAISAIHRLALVRLEDEYRQSRTIGQPDNDDMVAVDRKLNKIQGNPGLRERVQEAWHIMAGRAKDAVPPGELFNPDWVITHELALRYHNSILQDREVLQGADVSKAWQYAHALELEERERGARGEFFIYLDQESIDLLADAPSQEELARMEPVDRSKTAWDYWVKAVSLSCEVTEDGDDTDEMMKYPMGRRRIRVYDFFETFLHLCEGSLDEIGVEGNKRERYVQDTQRCPAAQNREWEFCENSGSTIIREPWLRELYGDKVPPTWSRHLNLPLSPPPL